MTAGGHGTGRRTVRAVVRGRVQGVGFRAWTRSQAELHGLDGWVRNRRDGTVETVLAGDPEAVGAMLVALRQGPRGCRVDAVEMSEADEKAVGPRPVGDFAVLGTIQPEADEATVGPSPGRLTIAVTMAGISNAECLDLACAPSPFEHRPRPVRLSIVAEHRIPLCRFNEQVVEAVGGRPYEHIMLIDGNDERGIDVGLMTRADAVIETVRSHVDDRVGAEKVFSRDCPEFHLKVACGERLVVLANHFKSKGYGGAAQSNARREAQARRVREIYDGLRADGVDHIAIAGDLNDTPASIPLAPLIGGGSDLKDISAHPSFDDGGRPGTYANGTKGNKIDYVLLSPALFAKVTGGGVFRRGVWGGKHGTLWPIYPETRFAHEAASDHAAIWADVAL